MTTSQLNFGAPPEFYTDAVQIVGGPYGFAFRFGLQTDRPEEASTQAIVRMSPQHALVMFQLLKKNLRQWEHSIGKIDLPDALFREMDIEREV